MKIQKPWSFAVSETRIRMPQKARPATAARAAQARWSPDARTAEAVRILVAGMAPLTDEQKSQLRVLLASPARKSGE